MTRKINFFDGVTSGTTPTTGNVTADNLVNYADDASYEAAVQGAPFTGNIYYNTTTNRIRYYDGTTWTNVVAPDTTDTLTNKSIDADANTITNIDNADIKALAGIDASKIADGTVSNTEYQYINSLTSNAQDQIDTAQGTADANTADIADVRTTTGTADGDTNMGAYTGSVLTDNQSTKQNIQELSDAIENLVSGLTYQGTWNADTNTPTLVSSTGTAGHYYIVSTAGSTNLDGISDWGVGDWVVFSDSGVWQKLDNSDLVTSVAGKTGAVTLDAADITDFDTEVSNNTSVTANTAKVSADGSINTHSDVDTTTTAPTTDQALIWDGSNWVPGDVAASGGSGLKNFFSEANSKMEVDDVTVDTDWYAFDDGSVTTPVDGNQAAATNISISNSTTSETITNTNGASARALNNSLTAYGESFTPLVGGNATSAFLRMKVLSVAPTGTFKYDLYATAAGVPTGSPIATTETYYASTIPADSVFRDYPLNFTTNPTLSASTLYAVVINVSGITDFGTGWQLAYNIGNVYLNGTEVRTLDGGSSWSALTGDQYFEVVLESNNSIEGTNSLAVSKENSTNAQGEGISCNMADIETGYQYDENNGRMIAESSFLYDTSDANYTGTMGVWIYDRRNTALIPILEADNFIPQGKGKFKFSYLVPQDDPDTSQLRLILMETDTHSNNYQLIFDDFKSGPDKLNVTVPLITSGDLYTPTLAGANSFSGEEFSYIYNGSRVLVEGHFNPGTTNTSLARMTLPNNLTARDIGFNGNTSKQIGWWWKDINSNPSEKSGPIIAEADSNSVWFVTDRDDSANSPFTKQQGSFLFTASAGMYVKFDVEVNELQQSTTTGLVQNSQLETLSTASDTKTPAGSNHFHALTNNSITLKAGKVYDLDGAARFTNSGTPNYSFIRVGIYGSNGTDTSSSPTLLSAVSTIQILSEGQAEYGQEEYVSNPPAQNINTSNLRVRALQDTTLYVVTFATIGTAADARILAFLNAKEVPFSQTAIVQQNKVARIYDEKAANNNGGASIAGTQDRVLNTIDDPFGLIGTLSSNLFTLSSTGKYFIEASAPANSVGRHKVRLTNGSNTIILDGTSEYCDNTNIGYNRSFISGYLNVTDISTQYKIRHYTELANANGLGAATNNASTPETYTEVKIWKIGE